MKVNLAIYSMDSKNKIASFLHPLSHTHTHTMSLMAGKPQRILKAEHSTLGITVLALILGGSEDC